MAKTYSNNKNICLFKPCRLDEMKIKPKINDFSSNLPLSEMTEDDDDTRHLNTTKSARLQSLNKYLRLIKEARRRKQESVKESTLNNKQMPFHLMPYTNVDEQKRLTKIAVCAFSLIVLVLVVFSVIDLKLLSNLVKSRRVKSKDSTVQLVS